MRSIVAVVAMLGLLGSASLAAGEVAESAEHRVRLNLSQSQEEAITQALSAEPAQAAPGYRAHSGSRPPDRLELKPLPDRLTARVPELARYLFVKLPDRILLIEPDSRLVAQLVGEPATTGTGPSASFPASPGSPQH